MRFRSALLRLCIAPLLALASACGSNGEPTGPGTVSESARVLAHLTVTGSPESPGGAIWVYRDTVDGVVYDLAGVLLKPVGTGPFPAVIVSHGFGSTATAYSRSVGTTMVRWGAVVIAANYTHAFASAVGAPGTGSEPGASPVNVQRAHRQAEILRALGYVDMNRLAAHGHSMGAFVTTALAATHPDLLRAASHTAGGVGALALTNSAPTEAQGAAVRTPYQLHHGERDFVVTLTAEQRLASLLAASGTTHEMHIYAGSEHNDVALDPVMLQRVLAWYTSHGLF